VCDFSKHPVKSWIEKYGGVTSFAYNVYSPMGMRDLAIINFGLTDTLRDAGIEHNFIQEITEVGIEKAETFNTKRGWMIQWIFPEFELDKNWKENMDSMNLINKTIEEGLDFLRLSWSLYGVM
jgi:hypothetical protein